MKILNITTGDYDGRSAKVKLFVVVSGQKEPTRKEIRALFPRVYEQLKIRPDVKATFSPKLGCSCGCSPGWALDISPFDFGSRAIWVTIR
jgi:hypothetical protein